MVKPWSYYRIMLILNPSARNATAAARPKAEQEAHTRARLPWLPRSVKQNTLVVPAEDDGMTLCGHVDTGNAAR